MAASEQTEPGALLRARVLEQFELEPDRLELLEQACRVADRIAALDQRADQDGLVQEGSTGQMILHPAISEARQQRQLLQRLLAGLGLPAADDGSSWDRLDASTRARRAALSRWGQHAG